MRAFQAKKSRLSGVTLIELLAVILIAGILAAASVPSFTAILKGTALKTAAASLTDTFSLARQFAITYRYVYRVELDTELTASEMGDRIDNSLQTDRYRVYFVDRKPKNPDSPRESEKITVRRWRLLPRFVEFDTNPEPPAQVAFDPTGGASAYDRLGRYIRVHPYKVRLLHTESGTKGKEKTILIKVNMFTGRATSEAG